MLTRPTTKNNQLAAILTAQKFDVACCPMLEIAPVPAPSLSNQLKQLRANDIVIAVSAHALKFAKELVEQWPSSITYYAIGQATACAMQELAISAISPVEPLTESLLELPSLQSLGGRRILILRGVGGRELLAQQLRQRGANVEYCELYQRRPIEYDPIILLQDWKKQNVKTIVVTSGEILKNLLILVGTLDKQWLTSCNLVVPSARVARLASEMGFNRCFIAAGADSAAVSQTLMKIQSNN